MKTEQNRSKELNEKILSILLAAAFADGKFHENEHRFIIDRSIENGLKMDEINKVLENPRHYLDKELNFKSEKEKEDFVHDIFSVVLADGILYESEICCVVNMLQKVNISTSIFYKVLIDSFHMSAEEVKHCIIPDGAEVKCVNEQFFDTMRKLFLKK